MTRVRQKVARGHTIDFSAGRWRGGSLWPGRPVDSIRGWPLTGSCSGVCMTRFGLGSAVEIGGEGVMTWEPGRGS